MSITPNEEMNVAELDQANRMNGARQVEAETKAIAAEAEITKIEADNANGSPSDMMGGGSGDTSLSGHAGGDEIKGNKALSTEGGFATDVALEAVGGSAIKVAKNVVDGVLDMNPAGKGNTMENFASPKSSASLSGKKCIFTGNQSSLSQLFGGVKIAGDSLNGETPIKGKIGSKQSAQELQAKIHRDCGLVNDKALGKGLQLKGQKLGQEREMRMAGGAPIPGNAMGGGSANVNAALKGPSSEYEMKPPKNSIFDEADAGGTG